MLVSNLDQSASSRFAIPGIEYAQSFTTGRSDALLSSIEVDLHQVPDTPANLTVSLWSADGSTPPRPLAHLHSLGKPALSVGLNTFSAPADTELAANTTYFIHLVDTSVSASSVRATAPQLTTGTAEDGVSVSGWSIGDQRFKRERGETFWNSRSTLMRMKVNGTFDDDPRLTGVALDSAPAFGDTFVLGEHVDVKATFSASVEVTEPAVALNLSLWFGPGVDVWTPARYVSGSGTRELIFRRVVQAGDAAPVGFLIGGSALGSTTRIVSAFTRAVVPTANLQNRGVRSGSLKVDGARGTLFCQTPAGAFWSACLAVGDTGPTKGYITGAGTLSHPTVRHGGALYGVSLLTTSEAKLRLYFDAVPRNAANWVLLVDDRKFAISDSNVPSGNTNTFEWSNPGLSWTVGQTVAVALGEKPGAAPTGLTATAAGHDRIALAWSATAGSVSGYTVEVSRNGRTGWTSLATVTGTSYTHPNRWASTTRHYRVRAFNNFGAGPASDTAQATVGSIVKRITIASDPGDGSYGPGDPITVRVEFADAVCYRRTRSANQAGIKLLVGSREREAVSTIATLSIVGPLTTMDFGYRVQSGDVDEDGISVPAGALRKNGAKFFHRHRHGNRGCGPVEVNVAHPAYGPFSGHRIYAAGTPGAPILRLATPAQELVALEWKAPTDNGGSAITGYRIEHSGDGGLTWEASDVAIGDEELSVLVGVYFYGVTGLSTSTTYRFRVSARNANGVGVPSAVLEATTRAAPVTCDAPPAGAFWSASLTVGRIPSGGYAGYDGTIGALTDTGFSRDGADYTIDGLFTTGSGLNLSFTAAPGAAADDWVLRIGDRCYAFADKSSVDAASHSVIWDNPGSSWNIDNVGDIVTVSLSGPAPAAPGQVTGLTATARGPTQIDLSWTAPADDDGATITDYKVEVCAQATAAECDTDAEWSELDSATVSTATTYAHTGLTLGTTRHYRVSAVNSAGAGPASAVASATTVAGPRITGIAITSDPGADGTYVTGDLIEVTVTFDQAVNAEVLALLLDLDIGDNRRRLLNRLPSASSGPTVLLQHRVLADDRDADGVSIPADNLRLYSAGLTIRNAAGVDAVLEQHEAVPADPRHRVNAATPPSPGLTASARGPTQIDLSWTAPANDGGSAITDYKIEVCAQATAAECDTDAEWSELDSATVSTDTTFAHTGLTSGPRATTGSRRSTRPAPARRRRSRAPPPPPWLRRRSRALRSPRTRGRTRPT